MRSIGTVRVMGVIYKFVWDDAASCSLRCHQRPDGAAGIVIACRFYGATYQRRRSFGVDHGVEKKTDFPGMSTAEQNTSAEHGMNLHSTYRNAWEGV